MMIRKTTYEDIPVVLQIIHEAKEYFRNNQINQWQGPYPLEEDIKEDIDQGFSYVYEEDGEVIGTCCIKLEDDPNYKVMVEGKWLNDEPYGVIHRIAIQPNKKGKGIAQRFFQYAQDMALDQGIYNLRIDTHKDNLSMQRAIQKFDFLYTGIVTVEDGSLRNAYQKVLIPNDTIERIEKMEEIYQEVLHALKMKEITFIVKHNLHLLNAYYQSPLWLEDYEKDENHLLPDTLKRGVLSQDGLYNLLSEINEVL